MLGDGLQELALQPGSATKLIAEIRAKGGFTPGVRFGHPNQRARFYGGILASRGGLDELDATLANDSAADLLDLFACWAHELVLRGTSIGGPRIDALAGALVAARHPLAHLPMHRLALETEAKFTPVTYFPNGLGGCGPGVVGDEAIAARLPVPRFVDMTSAADERIAAAFESHRTVSNGRSEHAVFALDPPAPFPADPALLAALPCECLAGAFPETKARTVAEVFAELLSFATLGGDYNSAWSAAYGRRDAWRSLGGLAGAPPDAPLHEIEARAREIHWSWFAPETPWFNNIATDYGVAAVSADGSSLAILAGTDTD